MWETGHYIPTVWKSGGTCPPPNCAHGSNSRVYLIEWGCSIVVVTRRVGSSTLCLGGSWRRGIVATQDALICNSRNASDEGLAVASDTDKTATMLLLKFANIFYQLCRLARKKRGSAPKMSHFPW